MENPILDTDGYKASHWRQLPPGTSGLYLYMGPRRGEYVRTLWFGLQYYLKRYLSQRVTRADVDEATNIFSMYGEPFNREGWDHIVRDHGGFLPVEIQALPEGTLVPNGIPCMTVRSTDGRVPWVAPYIETALMRAWYPSTVATVSWALKGVIRGFMEETCDDLSGLPFKLHDFGSRGVSSRESAGIGGLAHLVNFQGTDTLEAVMYGRRYYYEPMAGFSIPASEHGTITAWGREGEEAAYRNMIKSFGFPGKIFACVSDSYDVFNACEALWGGSLRQEVIDSGATVVIRPDSGDPAHTIIRLLDILDTKFGSVANSKGFRVLNSVRLIQGDLPRGRMDVTDIMTTMRTAGFSHDNVAFGMGGALLQKVNRDTQGFAMKTSAVFHSGMWHGVKKSPVGDTDKWSHAGLISTANHGGELQVSRLDEDWEDKSFSAMHRVFVNGQMYNEESLKTIRARVG